MTTITGRSGLGRTLVYLASSLLVIVSLAAAVNAQQPVTDHESHTTNSSPSSEEGVSLSEQLQLLQDKVLQLEAALKQNHQAAVPTGQMKMQGMQSGSMSGMRMKSGMGAGQPNASSTGMSMSGMKGMQMMGGMSKQDKPSMGGMGMMGGQGMSMMGKMQGMGQKAMPSALPGFPGASHLYHIGSTNFFLDHPQHITLTQEQQTKLNQIKQKTLLGQATFDRWESAAEQELWVLTSSDAPDASKIEAKVRETEKIRADKRVAFIRAVGEAANVLTDEQRQSLVGSLPLDHASQGQSN